MQDEVKVRKVTTDREPADSGDDLIWVVSQILGAIITLGLVFLLFRQTAGGEISTLPAKIAGLVGFCAAIYWLMSWHGRAEPKD